MKFQKILNKTLICSPVTTAFIVMDENDVFWNCARCINVDQIALKYNKYFNDFNKKYIISFGFFVYICNLEFTGFLSWDPQDKILCLLPIDGDCNEWKGANHLFLILLIIFKNFWSSTIIIFCTKFRLFSLLIFVKKNLLYEVLSTKKREFSLNIHSFVIYLMYI